MSELAAEWVAPSVLIPWKGNPRKNDGRPVQAVAESIRRFGFTSPILARRENGEVIAGHTRLKAALLLGLEQVPVRYLNLDAVDAHLLALADNRIGELAEWNEDQLVQLLTELRDANVEISVAGWNDDELLKLLKTCSGSDVTQDDPPVDRAEELCKVWKVEAGQLWNAGRHRILCGSSTDASAVATLMGGQPASWMWTDPPYGVSYVGKTKAALTIKNDGSTGLPALLAEAFSVANSVLAEGAPIYVAHPAGALSLEFGTAFVAAGWHFHETLIWVKDSMVLGHSDYHFKHEPFIYGWKGKNRTWFGDRNKVSLLEFPKPPRSDMHPTMKPVGLVAACISNSAPAGSVGFEPFSGSGTTMVAAEQTGRRCYAMELDPKFVAVALERMKGLGLTCEIA